jgi:hypothetical protein
MRAGGFLFYLGGGGGGGGVAVALRNHAHLLLTSCSEYG